MENEFLKLCKELEELNDFVHDLMTTQDAKEGEIDQVKWYKPKAAAIKELTKWNGNGLTGYPYNELSNVHTQGESLLVSTTLEPAHTEDVGPVETSSQVIAPAVTSSAAAVINDTQYMPEGTRYQCQLTSSISGSSTSSKRTDGMSNLVEYYGKAECDRRNTCKATETLLITSTQYPHFQWKSFGLPVFLLELLNMELRRRLRTAKTGCTFWNSVLSANQESLSVVVNTCKQTRDIQRQKDN